MASVSQRKQESKNLPLTSFLFLSPSLSQPFFFLVIYFCSVSFLPLHISLFLSLRLFSCLFLFYFFIVASFCYLGSFVSLLLDMKKLKGVAVAPRTTSPPPYGVYDDRVSFKHQSLLQDYDELYKETEVKKKKLEMTKQRRLTLSAEVRFLRQRYKHLMQNQYKKSMPEPQRPESSEIRSRNIAKKSSQNGKKYALPPPVPPFDLNKKGKTYIERQVTLNKPALSFDVSQKHKIYGAKEPALQDSRSILDLNERGRIQSGKEATVRNATPAFDLNQILIDEEELKGTQESLRMEEPKKSLIRAGSDDQYNDVMLSACRNIGNGPSKSGKRKISWQDQLVLRV